jgi:hypothetical protein
MREYCLMEKTPSQRLKRMRESFDANKSVLVDDYAYFTTAVRPRASTAQNITARKSAGRNGRRSLKPSETPSSDRNVD